MPGMRTSMITTSGFRRSAISTADAPSEASPTTRMCGARESESRSPSRSTSWSSTINAVISSAMGTAILRGKERKLFVALPRAQRRPPSIADTVLLRETADRGSHGLGVGLLQVRAALVQGLVVREQLRPVARQAVQEVLARPRTQVEQVRPDAARSGLAC